MPHRITVSIAGALTGALVSIGGIALLVTLQQLAGATARIASLALPIG